MAPRTQAILVGSVAAAAAWTAWFMLYAQGEGQTHLAAVGAEAAPSIAEDAAKAYIAERYGLTPDIMRRMAALGSTVSTPFRR